MGDTLELIDTMLASQRRAIRFQIALAALFIVVGLTLFGIGTLLSQQLEGAFAKPALLSVGGVLASILGAFPVKDLIVRRDKAEALKMLRARVQKLGTSAKDQAELEKVNELLWKSFSTIIEK